MQAWAWHVARNLGEMRFMSSSSDFQVTINDFRIDNMMRYSQFVPRLYNLCLSLGFQSGKIMPSRAFCSDENQGFPIILMTKHFGTFPFNYGRVGGIVATDLHGPLAHHGKDIVIIHASHVGYDPESGTFGKYCRLQTPDNKKTAACGKIGVVIQKYQQEYSEAQKKIHLGIDGSTRTVTIDNQLLEKRRSSGLCLDLEKIVATENGKQILLHTKSTSKVYKAGEMLCKLLPENSWQADGTNSIGQYLGTDLFSFSGSFDLDVDEPNFLEHNLLSAMPFIVTSSEPLLVAAQLNIQAEFDRAYRSIFQAEDFKNKRLLFISCLNIDISPEIGWMFPLTKCVPWAAYIQDKDGDSRILEQDELIEALMRQSIENPDQVNLETAIQKMVEAPEIKIVR